MVASDMATMMMKPPKAPRAKSTSDQQNTKPIYTRTLKANATSTANSVYKSRSDTSLTNSIRNLSIRSSSASSRSSTSSSSIGTTSQRFSSAGRGSKGIEDIARQIAGKHFKNIVVMAGAGISTASGIPDFRTPGTGLYDNLRQYSIPYPQAIFDIDYFARNPKPFYALAKELYPSGKYRPNYVHYFLRLLYEKGILLRVYTQNIDGLERLAGIPPQKIIEAHGSFTSASCTHCKQAYPHNEVKGAILGNKIPRCKKTGCFGTVKPDIVFFGEDLPRRFYYYLRDFPQADLLLVMGTSLEVEPFAGIVDSVRMYVPRILFNREAVGPFEKKRRMNDIVVEGDIVEKIRGFVMQLGWKKELEMLIEECENQYKRSIIESSTPATESSATCISMSRDGCIIASVNINKSASHIQNVAKAEQSKPKLPKPKPVVKEVQKVKEEEERKTVSQAPSAALKVSVETEIPTTIATGVTTGSANSQIGEKLIAGPNSCFNPAQLRYTRVAPAPANSSVGYESHGERLAGSNKPEAAQSTKVNQEGKPDEQKEGNAACAGQSGANRRTEEKPGDGNSEKNDQSQESKSTFGKSNEKCLDGGPTVRHSFEGVKRILGEAEKDLGNEPLHSVCSESSLPLHSNTTITNHKPAESEKSQNQNDDLKGFFTMPEPLKPKRSPDCYSRPNTSVLDKHSSQSPQDLISHSEVEMVSARDEAQRAVMIKEWLEKGQEDGKKLNTSGTLSDEEVRPEVKPISRSRSSSAHSTIRRSPTDLGKENQTKVISREIVRLKMRYNLNNQPQTQPSLFQRTHRVPPQYNKSTSENTDTPVRYAKSPTRFAYKHQAKRGTVPQSTDTRKPLFTGLRHINLKTQPVTGTVTKTTFCSNLAKPRACERETDLMKSHSAGSLPRISYQHRQPIDTQRSARMNQLLADAQDGTL